MQARRPDGLAHRKVLILAYYFPPARETGSLRPAAFARYLPEFGYRPIVLTCSWTSEYPTDQRQRDGLPAYVTVERIPSCVGPEDWNRYMDRAMRWVRPMERLLGGRPGRCAEAVAWRLWKRFPHWPWTALWRRPVVRAARAIIRRERPDIILATAGPWATVAAARRIKHQTAVPFIADYRDPFEPATLPTPTSRRQARRAKRAEGQVVRAADGVVVISETMLREMQEAYPSEAHKIELITNGYDDFPPLAARTSDAGKLVFEHVGGMPERRWPEPMIKAIRELRIERPEIADQIRVRFTGRTRGLEERLARLRSEGLEDIFVLDGEVNHAEAQERMQAADVLLLIEPLVRVAMTAKLLEYLGARRPILAMVPFGSDAQALIEQSGAGVNVGVDDPARVKLQICRYWELWREGRLNVQTDEKWLRQFHRRELTGKLARLFDAVIDERCASST